MNVGDNNMCHNLPRIGYKMPYNKVYTKEIPMTSIQELTTTNNDRHSRVC